MFWAYGPDKGDITILAVERHPEERKRGANQGVKLSALPSTKIEPGKKRKETIAKVRSATAGSHRQQASGLCSPN